MDEEKRAQKLAEWLDAPPGSAPPEGLDDEVLQAVFALRPERAPAPRTTAEDILAQVKEGPFATPAPTTGAVVGFPARPKKPRSSRVWWALPGVGVALAAAAAVAILVPGLSGAPSHDGVFEASRPQPASPPPPPAPTLPEMAAAPATEVPVAADAPPLGGAAVEAQAGDGYGGKAGEGAAGVGVLAGAEVPREEAGGSADMANEQAKPAPVTVPMFGVPDLAAARAEAERVARLRADASPAVAESIVPADASSTLAKAPSSGPPPAPAAEPSPDNFGVDEEADLAAPAPSARTTASGAVARGSGGSSRSLDDADAEESGTRTASIREQKKDEAVEEVVAAQAVSKSSAKAPARAAPPAASPAPAGTTTAPTATTGTTGSSAMESRTAATPLDYDAGWFRVYADLVPVYQQAAARESARDWAGAVELYRPLWSDARADVAQDAAWRGARALWAQGKAGEALAVVDAGLRKSSAPTVFRVHLLLVRGDLLNAMAKPTEAVRSWDDAAETNQQR